jgi:hypothetical protein
VIGNNPTVWGDGALALVEASGLLEWHEESFDEATKTATCTVKRLGKPSPTVRTFSFEEARAAGLLNKDGPWKGYPKRMCQMRARAFALRDTFADVLKGIGIAEEVRDHTPIGETRAYAANAPLSAAMLNQQASAEGPEQQTVDAEYVDAAEQQPAIPEWHEHDTRLRDLIFLAADLKTLKEVEREFLAVKALFPEVEQQRTQREIDAAFKALAEK